MQGVTGRIGRAATAMLGFGILAAWSDTALAQSDWPKRPISMMVGYPAGSATDTLARVMTAPLAQKFAQPFIVEDRPGADGNLMGRALARAETSGYVLGFGTTTSWAVAANVQPDQMGFDPRKDFASIGLVGETYYLLIVNANLGVNSIADLVALAKRSPPGTLNFSSTGNGSIAHLGMLIIAKRLGIEMTHVPYKSTAQSIVDVASGVIQLQLATISPTLPLFQAGKVKILGIASDHRSPLLPDVPTLAEQGAATTAQFSFGLAAPAGTPDAILKRVNQAAIETLQNDEIKKSYFKQGVEPKTSTPEQMARHVESEIEGYRKIIAEFGIATR